MTDVASAWLKQTNSVRQPSMREPARLFDANETLAAAGRSDDLGAPLRPREIEDLELGVRGPDQARPAVIDIVAQESSELDRRRKELVDLRDLGPGERSAAGAVTDPERPGTLEGADRGFGIGERVAIERDVASGIRTQEGMAAREAGEIDVGKRDGVAGPQVLVARPARQRLDRPPEVVLVVFGLLVRRPRQLVPADEPAALGIAARCAFLHLDHEQAVVGIDDDDVGLAVVCGPALPGLGDEPDVRVQPRLVGQRGSQSLLDEALRALPHGALLWASGRSSQPTSERGVDERQAPASASHWAGDCTATSEAARSRSSVSSVISAPAVRATATYTASAARRRRSPARRAATAISSMSRSCEHEARQLQDATPSREGEREVASPAGNRGRHLDDRQRRFVDGCPGCDDLVQDAARPARARPRRRRPPRQGRTRRS